MNVKINRFLISGSGLIQADKSVIRGAARSSRLYFSPSGTPELNKLTCLCFSHTARAQDPLQSHALKRAKNKLRTVSFTKHKNFTNPVTIYSQGRTST